MKNTGGRAAGTINGGIFLKEFVPQDVAWAHIDFAGVAHLEKEHGGILRRARRGSASRSRSSF